MPAIDLQFKSERNTIFQFIQEMVFDQLIEDLVENFIRELGKD